MPTHRIEVSQPPKSVLHSDITLSIYSDKKFLGEIRISKGSIDWRSPYRQRARRIRWEKFAQMMDEQ